MLNLILVKWCGFFRVGFKGDNCFVVNIKNIN